MLYKSTTKLTKDIVETPPTGLDLNEQQLARSRKTPSVAVTIAIERIIELGDLGKADAALEELKEYTDPLVLAGGHSTQLQ